MMDEGLPWLAYVLPCMHIAVSNAIFLMILFKGIHWVIQAITRS